MLMPGHPSNQELLANLQELQTRTRTGERFVKLYAKAARARRERGGGSAIRQAGVISAASGVWDKKSGQLVEDQLARWKLAKGQDATWDAVYLDPEWARQQLRLYMEPAA
ncbi:hypothetical protein HaLaN_03529 [Haematococcus lacustris]|uniref:Uncharacterized protein n=1 Tax=Haematococcus lacustris TaxID=44745 RepID=A0A699YQT8_HAELA|nr:hypothetical protein HaLaN_03529 [Haematococcus lacustris]